VADISFLEQLFQARQDSHVRYLADMHNELDNWQEEGLDERRA